MKLGRFPWLIGLVAVASVVGAQPASAQTFNFTVVGNARQFDNVLRLTRAVNNEDGAGWSTARMSVGNGFTANFHFQIDRKKRSGADGFAFVIQNLSGRALGQAGGGMGYDGIRRSLAVEFDTWHNGEFGDPNANHISVHSRGLANNSPDEAYSLGSAAFATPQLSSGTIHDVAVVYTPGSLEISMNGGKVDLIVAVDLNVLLGLPDGKAWVGFTGATGGAAEFHDVRSFEFQST